MIELLSVVKRINPHDQELYKRLEKAVSNRKGPGLPMPMTLEKGMSESDVKMDKPQRKGKICPDPRGEY